MNVTMDKNRVQLRLIGAPSLLKVVLPRKNALQFSFKARSWDLSQVSVHN